MEKIIVIDGKPINFKSTGAYLLRYKAQFGRDALQDIFKLQGAVKEQVNEETGEVEVVLNDINTLDLEVIYNLIWTLAKTADPNIPPPMEWLDQFSEFPLMDIAPQVIDMIFSCLGATVEPKKK